jgi:hypothetical protein
MAREYNINGKWLPFQGRVLGSNPCVRKKKGYFQII